MRRKLVKQGAATMMISLPSKWIKENKLEKGDEIDLEEENNSLVISSSLKEKKKELTLEIDDTNKKDIPNFLTQAYRKGFDVINIKGNYKDSLKEIKNTITELLLGFELTSSSKNNLTIENISEPTEQKYEVMIKKVFQIIGETQDLVLLGFQNSSFKDIQEIQELKKQQDRFILFCRRLISKFGSKRSNLSEWEILSFLMHIEHRYYYLYKYCSENKGVITKNMVEILKIQKEAFNLYSSAYFDLNLLSVNKLYRLRDEYFFDKAPRFIEKAHGKESFILSDLREILRLIQIGSSPIASEILESKHLSENKITKSL